MQPIHAKPVDIFRVKSTVPKYLLQGSLFAASRIATPPIDNIIQMYDGKELEVHHRGFTQFDLAVSLAYKRIINQHRNFDDIKFSIAEFARALNRIDGGKTRQFILEAFRKSNDFHLCFDFGTGRSFDGSRLNSFRETRKNVFNVSFNMDYLSMTYDSTDTCDIDIDMFMSLQLGLQSWLYGFICSVPELDHIDIDLLYRFSGSNYKNSSDFRKAIKEALSALYKKGILGWRHGIARYGEVFWEYKNPFQRFLG